jgi:hypothetical protein
VTNSDLLLMVQFVVLNTVRLKVGSLEGLK